MKLTKRIVSVLLTFALLIPNTIGDVFSEDIIYPNPEGEYYAYEGNISPVKVIVGYGDSDRGILTTNSNSASCSETTDMSSLFDGQTNTGLILRDDHNASGGDTWDGYVVAGDYIGVEFEQPINLERVKFTFDSANSGDTYNKGTIQFLSDENAAEWKDLQIFNNSKLITAEYNSDTIYNVKAVRVAAGDTERTRKWVRIHEIEIEGTLYEESPTVNKDELEALVAATTKTYSNETIYTAESFAPFKAEYLAAQLILSDASAKQWTVNNAVTILRKRKSTLVWKTRNLGELINTSADTDIEVTADNAHTGHEANKTLDYQDNTHWHTNWSGTVVPLPLSITYDLAKEYDLTDIQFKPRQDGQYNGDIFEFDLYVGNDVNALELISHFTMETSETGVDEQLASRDFNRAIFDATGRYVKMTITRGGSNNSGKQNWFASMAEIRFYGAENVEEDNDGYINDVDKTMLGDLLEQADSLIGTNNSADQYTQSSFATYLNAYNVAWEVYENDEALEALVTEVYNLLLEAMNNLVDIEVLSSNIAIKKQDLEDGVDKSNLWKTGFQTLIDEVEALLTKGNVTQDEINAAVERLDVIEAYADLYEGIEEAKAIDVSNKTEESIAALNSAIEDAEAILNNKAATYDELVFNTVTIVDKVEKLVDRPVDKTELLAALEATKAIYESNNPNSTYTSTSFEKLKEAYEVAHPMKDKAAEELRQVDIENATEALLDALNGLVQENKYLTNDEITIKVIGNEENDNTQALSNIFDGNPNTVWHTKWGGSDRNLHYFTLQVPVNYYDQIELLPRPKTGDGYQNGVFTEVKVYAKLYAPKDNVEQGDTWIEVAHATGLNQDGWQVVEFNEPVKAEYIKVEVVNAMSANNKLFASLAEMKIHSSAAQLDNKGWKSVAYFSDGSIAEYKDNLVAYEMATSGLDEKEGPTEYMFDGTTATHYHTDYDYKNEEYYSNPITFIIKMGSNQTFNYIDWLNRKDNVGCRLSQFDVYTIDDDGDFTDDELKNGAPWVQKFAITAENQANNRFYLGEQTTKYVKIVATSADSGHHIACAELDFYQVEAEEAGEIRYSGMNTTLNPKQWIKESAYNQAKEVKGYYGIVNDVANKFSNSEANIVRYITSSVLSVKAQSQVVGDVINVRFLTSIASTNLEALRFKVEILNSDGTVKKSAFVNTNRVFGSVVADNVEISNAASVFGNNVSTHFAVCKLNNIPVSLKDDPQQTKIRVTPYWAPVDVTEDDNDNYVKGISRTFTVKELHDNASNTNTMNE